MLIRGVLPGTLPFLSFRRFRAITAITRDASARNSRRAVFSHSIVHLKPVNSAALGKKGSACYEKALSKAREEALKATGAQLEKLTNQINAFEAKLDEARKKKERAIARAQLTKSGFVYVISNIGSFGERVFKIGMTRRLEPKVREFLYGLFSRPAEKMTRFSAVPLFAQDHVIYH